MSKQRTIELANVVINFGDKGLVDNLRDHVLPNLTTLRGRGEVREYRFLGLKLSEITQDKTPVMFGRLVKMMNIEAEQEFDEQVEELISSSKQIPSAPSSFFLINLINHRMAFLGETRRSPSLKDFEYCVSRLLLSDWRTRYNAKLQEILRAEERERIPKGKKDEYHARVLAAVPEPDVRVTPLPAQTEIDKKMGAFAKLTTVTVRPMKTNNELPDENAAFLRKYAEQQRRLGTSSSKLELVNGTDGLEKNEAQKLVKAASDGNFKVTMKGTARNGNKISGDLDQLSVKLKEQIPARESDTDRANRLLSKMKEAFDAGFVLAANTVDGLADKAKAVIKAVNGE